MSDNRYGHVSPGIDSFQLQDRSPRRDSLSLSSEDSDISYRDNLDDEPFGEKDRRFQDEGTMEDGEGYITEPSRVCSCASRGTVRLTAVTTEEKV